MSERLWPGTICPECLVATAPWDVEYHVASTGPYGVAWVAKQGEERLVSLTCPKCKTKFKIPEPPK